MAHAQEIVNVMKVLLFNLMLCSCDKYITMLMKERSFFDDLCFVLAGAPVEYKFNKGRNFACFCSLMYLDN